MELKELYELMERFRESGLAKLEIRQADMLVRMEMPRKSEIMPAARQYESAVPDRLKADDKKEETPEKSDDLFIRSPIVGTFYAAPGEGMTPYVKAGDKVRKGDTLCIVEAMKMMNEISAPYDCEILEICKGNAEPAGYDDPLFKVREI
ncbi:MAG: acetyl-CoA carboxylase biotin carboxyl carrier protein [Eubacteriales bacterium]|nr:acetyl-CoA carboxylase biotin carboxyl carrier protein [Eubacteriales bacterium]